jgi:hypothetical protein
MENSELQSIWRSFDTDLPRRTKEELNWLLSSKTRQTIRKFVFVLLLSILVCAGLLAFLIYTALHRQDDPFYLANNGLLGVVTLLSLLSGLWSWRKLQWDGFDQPLKVWLEARIVLLTKWLTGRFGKLYLFLIPLLYLLVVLSIHVYFEAKPFLEVLHTEESVVGLLVGAPVGLFVSYWGARAIRRYQMEQLGFLKDLHRRLISNL